MPRLPFEVWLRRAAHQPAGACELQQALEPSEPIQLQIHLAMASYTMVRDSPLKTFKELQRDSKTVKAL